MEATLTRWRVLVGTLIFEVDAPTADDACLQVTEMLVSGWRTAAATPRREDMVVRAV